MKVQLNVGQQPKASLFVFQAIAADGVFAQKYLDACMEEYMNVKKQMRSDKSETTLNDLKDELDRTEKELRTAEDKLLTFQTENNLGSLKEEGNSAAVYLAKLKLQLAELKTEHNLLERLDIDQTLERRSQVGDSAATVSDSPLTAFGPAAEYVGVAGSFRSCKSRGNNSAHVMRPKHPDMIRLAEEIARAQSIIDGLRQQTAEQIKSRRAAIAIQIEHLDEDIRTWEAKALELSGRIADTAGYKERWSASNRSVTASLPAFGMSMSPRPFRRIWYRSWSELRRGLGQTRSAESDRARIRRRSS